jgi:benzoyl-CoA reductase/2-hydroxyglutaryl-CoA dehydratase subunit BcrC/BadD/HgdB
MNILIDVVDEENGNVVTDKPIKSNTSELREQRDALEDMYKAMTKLTSLPIPGLNNNMVNGYSDNLNKTVTLLNDIINITSEVEESGE